MASSASRYDNLRKQSHTLESLVQSKLSAYARLASTVTRSADLEAGSTSIDRLRDAENEVEGLIDKVGPSECILSSDKC